MISPFLLWWFFIGQSSIIPCAQIFIEERELKMGGADEKILSIFSQAGLSEYKGSRPGFRRSGNGSIDALWIWPHGGSSPTDSVVMICEHRKRENAWIKPAIQIEKTLSETFSIKKVTLALDRDVHLACKPDVPCYFFRDSIQLMQPEDSIFKMRKAPWYRWWQR